MAVLIVYYINNESDLIYIYGKIVSISIRMQIYIYIINILMFVFCFVLFLISKYTVNQKLLLLGVLLCKIVNNHFFFILLSMCHKHVRSQ